MSFVLPTDFIGEVNIPNNGDTYLGTASNIQYFIDKYEAIFLENLLGYELYNLYLIGITPVAVVPTTDPITYVPIDAKWLNIQTITKQLIVNFIYYYYKLDEFTYSSGTGESKSKGENSTIANPARKMVSRWNEMVNGVYKIVKYWDVETYGLYYIDFKRYGYYWHYDPLTFFVYGRFNQKVPNIFFTVNTFQI
jgi:hypothetical protein